MSDLQTRLTSCFIRVFPNLPAERIPTASPQTVAEWDSIAAISLVNVIEEEFETQIDFEYLSDLDSFDKIATYLKDGSVNGQPTAEAG